MHFRSRGENPLEKKNCETSSLGKLTGMQEEVLGSVPSTTQNQVWWYMQEQRQKDYEFEASLSLKAKIQKKS